MEKFKEVFWCKNCVTMSTRPRMTFDERGFCSACQWSEEKKQIDWSKRQKMLEDLLNKHRAKGKKYDCITTVSGGKDGSYVSYNIKNKHNMDPLAVTFRPIMETDIGQKNLNSFVESGYDHLHITPDKEAMRVLNKIGLTELGFPYYGWLMGIHTAVLRVAIQMNIPLIFYSEDGEVEYGGDAKFKNQGIYDVNYQISRYMEGGYEKIINQAKQLGLTDRQLYWFTYPSKEELKNFNLELTHYGFYENWDPYRNYVVAKDKCGLQEAPTLNEGSYTNFAQTDQKIYELHVYFMYLKFGFGRATQDAGIDVRRGAMTRSQAVQLVQMYDDIYPEKLFEEYCDYYKMTMKEFQENIDKWANKELFVKKNKWVPKFKIS